MASRAVAVDAVRELSACECPVCFCLLTGQKAPMSLPCGHTLCKVCISQLTEKMKGVAAVSNGFPCPMCRKFIQEESVSLNVTLRDLIGGLVNLCTSSCQLLW